MPGKVILRILILLFFSLPVLPAETNIDQDISVDFVYVNSNVGQSSGGHTAFRIGSIVYHFQFYPDGLFRLVRDNWEEFAYIYNVLDNRSLTIHKIKVNHETFTRFKETFNRYYLIQEKHIQNILSLRNDIAVLEKMNHKDHFTKAILVNNSHWHTSIQLPGKGYFSDFAYDEDDAFNFIETFIKKKELENEILTIDDRIKKFKPENYKINIELINQNSYPLIKDISFAEKYLDMISRKEAIEIILKNKKLKPQSYFYTTHANDQYELTEFMRNKLILAKSNLESEIISLLKKQTYGDGFTLLTTLARYKSVKLSLESNKMVILKCFNKESILVKVDSEKEQNMMKELINESFTYYEKVLENFINNESYTPLDFHILEDAANRNFEIRSVNTPLRMTFEKLLPVKTEEVQIELNENFSQNRSLLINARENEKLYYNKLLHLYNYNLFKKNCATEIFRTIANTMDHNPVTSKAKLGGFIPPDESLAFIPFIASRKVQKRYNLISTEKLDSYRLVNLQKIKLKKNSFLVELKESNTISSSFYKFNADDSLFIFFTDKHVLLRPLYGLFNLGAGFLQTSWGILKLPFDKGDQFSKGIQGMVFSLPEIIFINIRKGTFQFIKREDLPEYLHQ